jgi:inorganic pyrophosphatase
MPNFINLPPFAQDRAVRVVIETPRGSRAKFAYDPKLETFTLTKSLLVGLTYPHDWGFVPSTRAERRSARCYGHSRRGDFPRTGARLPHHRHSPDPAEE